MTIIPHTENLAEVQSETLLIATAEDGLDIMGTLYFEGYDRIILHAANITPDFFDLKTGIAGEILQKFPITVCDWPLWAISNIRKAKACAISSTKATRGKALILWDLPGRRLRN